MATEIIGRVTLLDVRLSFASLFEPNRQTNDDGSVRENWKSNFLIPKDETDFIFAVYKGKKLPILSALKAAGIDARKKKWGESEDKWPKLKPQNLFLRDGDLESWDGYPGCHYISSNADLGEPPSVITNRKDADGKWIQATPGGQNSPYSGCYTNAVIEVWAQDNKHGKRLNAKLKSVQFRRNGEAFGAAPVDPNQEFTDDMVSSEGSIEDEETGTVSDLV